MMSGNPYERRDAPNNWVSLKKYEEQRGLEAGEVTAAQDGKTPKAWVNTMTLRVVYRLSPFSNRLYLGEMNKSGHVIEPESFTDFETGVEPKKMIDEAFDYMEHDNGMTPIDSFIEN